jgi:DnaK suppressor protein
MADESQENGAESNGHDPEHAERLAKLKEQAAEALARYDLAAGAEDRGDGHHHPAEVATDMDERERELHEQLRWRERAEALQAAEQAMSEGTYGICVDCGAEISAGRLRIKPDAARCVDCQRQVERGTT